MSEELHDLQKELYSSYQKLNELFTKLRLSSMEEGDMDSARYYAAKETGLARLFEMGWYHELAPKLDIAAAEHNGDEMLAIIGGLLDCLPTISDFTKSRLFDQMTFDPPDEDYLTMMREDIICGLFDEEFSYVQKCEGFEAFREKWEKYI